MSIYLTLKASEIRAIRVVIVLDGALEEYLCIRMIQVRTGIIHLEPRMRL